MLTDLVQIRRLGENKREENERFRRYLKRHNWVERRFRHIAEEAADAIDCTTCANCCRVATARVTDRDVEKLARFLRVKPAEFVSKYCDDTKDEGLILKRNDQGCVFLSGNTCMVYEVRPHTCEYFPHLVRGEGSVESRMWQFIDRACYCPIVYNTLEEFKDETKFR